MQPKKSAGRPKKGYKKDGTGLKDTASDVCTLADMCGLRLAILLDLPGDQHEAAERHARNVFSRKFKLKYAGEPAIIRPGPKDTADEWINTHHFFPAQHGHSQKNCPGGFALPDSLKDGGHVGHKKKKEALLYLEGW